MGLSLISMVGISEWEDLTREFINGGISMHMSEWGDMSVGLDKGIGRFVNKDCQWEGGVWLAQSVEHATLDLWVVSSSPMLGIEIS